MAAQIIGPRLKALRAERGLTQDAIVEMLGVGSRQIVSQIENGERRVTADELLRLSDGLNVGLEYFTDPYRLTGEAGFSWRQSGRTLADLKSYEDIAGSWIAMFRYEAPRVGRPAPLRRPKLPLTRYSSYEEAMAEGERVALELELGDVPARDLPNSMESKFGILVLMVDAIEGVSGAACRLPELDAVLVNRNEVAGRRHFDLAHELFHIMTWEQMPPEYTEDPHGFGVKKNRVEQLADNFASALLMPERILERFGEWRKLGEAEIAARLNEVAEILQVTAQALKWRLVALGRLARSVAQGIADALLRFNGRFGVAFDAAPPLFSRRFMEVVGLSIDKGFVSRRRAAKQLGLQLDELQNLFATHGVPCPESL